MASIALLLAACLSAPARAAGFGDVLPGARAMGMGGAFTAVADDPYAIFYNPGGTAGSDFTTMSGTMGRMFSPVGPLSFAAFAYHRPFPLREDSNVGASFLSLREQNGGDKDQIGVHYSELIKVPQLMLAKPIRAGANAKIVSVDASKGKKVGLGLDAGVVIESNIGLQAGVAVLDLMPDVGLSGPALSLGAAYLLGNRLTIAGDLRTRSGLTEFYPGLEASFFEGLLKARVGKGVPLHGVSQIAFGAGVNFSPLVIDWAMTVPFNGFTRNGGAFQMSIGWKFGAPPFYGRFVGTAARRAEDLKGELLELEDRKRTLETQVATAESNKESVEGQLRSMENRARSLQEQVRSLEQRVDERRYELQSPPKAAPAPIPVTPVPPPAPKPTPPPKPAAAPFPRKHAVAPGDTLRSIAHDEYGDPNLWELIYNANTEKIDRGLPREGEILLIPSPR